MIDKIKWVNEYNLFSSLVRIWSVVDVNIFLHPRITSPYPRQSGEGRCSDRKGTGKPVLISTFQMFLKVCMANNVPYATEIQPDPLFSCSFDSCTLNSSTQGSSIWISKKKEDEEEEKNRKGRKKESSKMLSPDTQVMSSNLSKISWWLFRAALLIHFEQWGFSQPSDSCYSTLKGRTILTISFASQMHIWSTFCWTCTSL